MNFRQQRTLPWFGFPGTMKHSYLATGGTAYPMEPCSDMVCVEARIAALTTSNNKESELYRRCVDVGLSIAEKYTLCSTTSVLLQLLSGLLLNNTIVAAHRKCWEFYWGTHSILDLPIDFVATVLLEILVSQCEALCIVECCATERWWMCISDDQIVQLVDQFVFLMSESIFKKVIMLILFMSLLL